MVVPKGESVQSHLIAFLIMHTDNATCPCTERKKDLTFHLIKDSSKYSLNFILKVIGATICSSYTIVLITYEVSHLINFI